MREVAIAGVGVAKFDRYDGQKGRPLKEFYEFGNEAVLSALKDAGMEFKDIQEAFCGNLYQQSAGQQVLAEIGLTALPVVNVSNACSSSSSAFRMAYKEVAAGFYDIVLTIGVEKVPPGFLLDTHWQEWERYMGFNVQPANYALATVRYMEESGTTSEQIAKVTVKNRKNATLNPDALFQKEVTVEEVLNSRMICKPLRLLNVCANADGATAIVLCSKDKLKSKNKMVTVAASVFASETFGHAYGGDSVTVKTEGLVQISAGQAWKMSGYGPEDMDVVEAYDTMAPSELWDLEKMGFCKKGEAGHLLEEGVFDLNGRLPVNMDGGLLGRGHPIGATGAAQIIEVVRQLRGEAGPRQVPGAKIGLTHSMGAGGNSCITILKR